MASESRDERTSLCLRGAPDHGTLPGSSPIVHAAAVCHSAQQSRAVGPPDPNSVIAKLPTPNKARANRANKATVGWRMRAGRSPPHLASRNPCSAKRRPLRAAVALARRGDLRSSAISHCPFMRGDSGDPQTGSAHHRAGDPGGRAGVAAKTPGVGVCPTVREIDSGAAPDPENLHSAAQPLHQRHIGKPRSAVTISRRRPIAPCPEDHASDDRQLVTAHAPCKTVAS